MNKLTAFLTAFLFSTGALASGLQASFSGADLFGLTRATTRCEYDGSIDASGNLLDKSGYARHLSPTHAPTTSATSLQRNDGNKWLARTFDGANDYYSLAHASWMNLFTTDHTITLLFRIDPSSGTSQYLFCKGVWNSSGISVSYDATSFYIVYWKGAGDNIQATFSVTATRDGFYHVIQIVKSGTGLKSYFDGALKSTSSGSGYGTDNARNMYLGAYDSGATPVMGSILYTRIDAEALTEERLAYEKDYLLGLAARSGTASIGWDFTRSSVATFDYSDKSVSYSAAANIPRVSGDGGGVRIEGSGTQILTYTGDFSTNWLKQRSSIAATSVVLPDKTTGTTNTLKESDDAATTHYLGPTGASATAIGTSYVWSLYVKHNASSSIPRQWIKLYYDDGLRSNIAYINIKSGLVGTTSKTFAVGGYGITPAIDGWFRVWLWSTAEAASGPSMYIYVAEGDNDDSINVTVPGGQDSVYIAFPQYETGTFPTSYIPKAAATAATRSQDNLLIMPYKLGKDLTVPGTTPKAVFSFETQDPLAATMTDDSATYTFTRTNTVTALNDYTRMRRFVFVPANTARYTLSDTDTWAPTGSFSVVAVITPGSVPTPASGNYMYVFNKWNAGSNKRSWALYYNDTPSWLFATSQTGTSGTASTASKSSSVVVGRPQLLVGVYTHTGAGALNNLKLYVDDLTVANVDSAYGPPYRSGDDVPVNIGRSSGAGSYFDGQIHYLAFYDGVAIQPDQVTALYAKFKQANILPTGLGTNYVGKYLTIEFSAKCRFSSSTDMGADRTFIDIGSSYLTGSSPAGATTTRNRVYLYAESSDGKFYADFYSGTSTTRRYMYSAAITTYNQWHKYKVFYDFSDLDSSNIWVDGAAGTVDATMTTGEHAFNLTDTFIHVGQPSSDANSSIYGTTDGACQIKDLRIVPGRF